MAPVFAFAADCSEKGETVIFVNGILGDEILAIEDKDLLKKRFLENHPDSNIYFFNGFNPSHFKVFGDLFKSVTQAYGGGYVDYDLTNILRQMHTDLKTRKVLLVGHSQGTFYTNEAYNYLIQHGVPAQSIGVYNVATPADYVAGSGNYVTSSSDTVINSLVRQLIELSSAKRPLPANIDIELDEAERDGIWSGHSFSRVYLKSVPEKIIGDMKAGLDGLVAKSEAVMDDGCFIAPENTLVHRLKGVGFLVGDNVSSVAYDATYYARQNALRLAKTVYNIYAFSKNMFVASLPLELPNAPIAQSHEVEPETEPEPADEPEEAVTSGSTRQDQIDDILERIDMLRRQMADLEKSEKENNEIVLVKDEDQENEDGQEDEIGQIDEASNATKANQVSRNSGGNSVVYPKLLISEVQIASFVSGKADEKQEFVELYNPNNSEVSLAEWYLQRKTKSGSSFSSFAPNTLFSNKKIVTHGYFLIAREGSIFASLADVLVGNPLTQDNSLVLKNPNGEISDKLGWGQAQEYETAPVANPSNGHTMGRKFIEAVLPEIGTEIDTDNNSGDFEFGLQTPRAQHIKYVEGDPADDPPADGDDPPPQVPLKNILINEIQVAGETVGDEFIELYNPNTVDVDLADFSLKKKTSTGTESNLVSAGSFSGIIKASGFFLIAPQDDADGTKNYTGLELPDLRFSGKTFSIASNNTVLLYNKEGILLDKVGFGEASDFEAAPAVNPDASQSIERKKIAQDSDNNATDFTLSEYPTPKGTFPKAIIKDATDYSFPPSSSSPGAPMHDLLLKWQSPSQNIKAYRVQYKLNDGEWVDWLAETQQNQEYFKAVYSLFNDHVYSFRVRATDNDGNIGDWSPEITFDVANPVVINEVGYAGTDADAKDQWIELYNRTDQEIDLSGWSIVSGTNGAETLNLSLEGKIPAHGYFILERTDDETLSDVPAHQIFIQALGKSYLYLKSPSKRYVDEFYISEAESGAHRYSLERLSAFAFGSESKNWKINNGESINGADRKGGQIYATPGQQNSVNQLYTYYNNAFVEDTVLKKSQSPYVFGGISIFKDVTVTIEPGVVIKFDGLQSTLTVHGTLRAIGSESEKITVTSFKDDEFGGDTNGDGADSLPAPGNWLGIYFSKDSMNSALEYVDVRYGGGALGSSPFTWGNSIWVDQTDISLTNSTVKNNKNRGLLLVNSNSTIDTVSFSGHQATDWTAPTLQSKAIDIQGGNPVIKNSYFEDNAFGIYASYFEDPASGQKNPSEPVIENNNFINNGQVITVDSLVWPLFSNNKASGNTLNGIMLAPGAELTRDLVLGVDLPYVVKGIITIPQNIALKLQPGVIVQFWDNFSGIQVDGTLHAIGTPDNHIIFKSHHDGQEGLLPGAWLGLHFTKTSQNSQLEYIDISYGGAFYSSQSNEEFSSAIKVDQSVINLKNSTIRHVANNGVWLQNSPSVIDGVQFVENTRSTIESSDAKALYVQGGSPIIANSHFENNMYGIYMDSWHNPDTGEDVEVTPDYSQNNTFLGNQIADIWPIPFFPSPPE